MSEVRAGSVWDRMAPSTSIEDHEDAQQFESRKRKQISNRVATLERRVGALATTVNLMLSVMDAEARMKGGIDRLPEKNDGQE